MYIWLLLKNTDFTDNCRKSSSPNPDCSIKLAIVLSLSKLKSCLSFCCICSFSFQTYIKMMTIKQETELIVDCPNISANIINYFITFKFWPKQVLRTRVENSHIFSKILQEWSLAWFIIMVPSESPWKRGLRSSHGSLCYCFLSSYYNNPLIF